MDYQNNGPVRSGDYGTASPQYSNSAPLPSDKKGLAIAALIMRILYVRKRREQIKAARRERRLREMARQQLAMEEDRRRRNWTD